MNMVIHVSLLYRLVALGVKLSRIAAWTAMMVFSFELSPAREIPVSSASQITQAMATAVPGDTLLMTIGIWMNQQILFQGMGTAGNPIVLRARTFGSVTLSGTSKLKIAGNYLVAENLNFQNGNVAPDPVIEFRNGSLESNHCRLTNSSISSYSPPDVNTDNKWVSLYGTYNRVDRCSMTGKTNSGTTLVVWLSNRPNYHRIDYNYFGPRPVLGVNGGETIRVGTSDWSLYDSFTTVEYNLFDRCNGEIEIISNKSCGNVYRYNTFLNSQGALTLRHGNRCLVEGNFILANGVSNSGGIRIIGEDHVVINNYVANTTGTGFATALTMMNGVPNSPLNRYFQVKRAVVAFNTFVDNRVTFHIGAGKDSELTLPPLDCIIANNVMLSQSFTFFTLTDSPINMLYAGNVYFSANLGVTSSGFTHIDPQLSTVGPDGLRRLINSSPVINQAIGAHPLVVLDMDGQSRDSLKDVGADEYATTSIVRRPLTIADVGPGSGVTSVRSSGHHDLPLNPRLITNYPNPFNPVTTIEFEIPVRGQALVRVFDSLGRETRILYSGQVNAHERYRVRFDATNLASGTYFCRLDFEGSAIVRPIILMR